MVGRFERTTPPYLAIGVDDAFARDVLHAYQRYWWQALYEPASRPGAEAQLGQRLADLLGEAAPRGEAAFDAMLDRLGNALRERGFHVQQGRTLPLYDLLLWRTREEREFRVALPEGTEQPVRVYLLDGFVSRGWGSYARCDRGGAAGWAKPEGLYAVRERYPDLDAERFRVSFLGHEAQHFADMKRWPEMEPWVLEYRAKLVELALADETAQATLQRFHESQDDSPDHPHPYANRQVIAAVDAQLGGGMGASPDLRQVDGASLRSAARAVLIDDTRKRSSVASVNETWARAAQPMKPPPLTWMNCPVT